MSGGEVIMRGFKFILLVVVTLFIVSVSITAGQKVNKDESFRKGETRDTLNPNLFSHPAVRAAYQAAKEIPWVLDSIRCYCLCDESPVFKHKSLLSCYVDGHAAG